MPEREEILAPVHALVIESEVLQSGARQLGQLHGKKAISVERMIFERIRRHLRLAQIRSPKVVEIDDQNAVGFQVRKIHLQRGGIHGDQSIHGVAGRENVVRREMHLESADAGQRARRGANFSGKVGKRRQIVAVQRDRVGELAAGDLHAVAGVAAETDYGLVNYFALALRNLNGGQSHSFLGPHVHECGEIRKCTVFLFEIFHADENLLAPGKRSTTRVTGKRKLGKQSLRFGHSVRCKAAKARCPAKMDPSDHAFAGVGERAISAAAQTSSPIERISCKALLV